MRAPSERATSTRAPSRSMPHVSAFYVRLNIYILSARDFRTRDAAEEGGGITEARREG